MAKAPIKNNSRRYSWIFFVVLIQNYTEEHRVLTELQREKSKLNFIFLRGPLCFLRVPL